MWFLRFLLFEVLFVKSQCCRFSEVSQHCDLVWYGSCASCCLRCCLSNHSFGVGAQKHLRSPVTLVPPGLPKGPSVSGTQGLRDQASQGLRAPGNLVSQVPSDSVSQAPPRDLTPVRSPKGIFPNLGSAPSGCAKSSLPSVRTRLEPPSSGHADFQFYNFL